MANQSNVVIDYTISDGNGGTDSAQLTVTVTGTNDGPVAVNNSGTTDEDTSQSFDVLANDSDPDANDTLTITAASINTGLGTASVVGNQVVYNPGTDYNYLAVDESVNVVIDLHDQRTATGGNRFGSANCDRYRHKRRTECGQ